MSRASEMARDQNADPEHCEPREILVAHLAPLSAAYGMGGKDTSITPRVQSWHGGLNRVGGNALTESHVQRSWSFAGTITPPLLRDHLECSQERQPHRHADEGDGWSRERCRDGPDQNGHEGFDLRAIRGLYARAVTVAPKSKTVMVLQYNAKGVFSIVVLG